MRNEYILATIISSLLVGTIFSLIPLAFFTFVYIVLPWLLSIMKPSRDGSDVTASLYLYYSAPAITGMWTGYALAHLVTAFS